MTLKAQQLATVRSRAGPSRLRDGMRLAVFAAEGDDPAAVALDGSAVGESGSVDVGEEREPRIAELFTGRLVHLAGEQPPAEVAIVDVFHVTGIGVAAAKLKLLRAVAVVAGAVRLARRRRRRDGVAEGLPPSLRSVRAAEAPVGSCIRRGAATDVWGNSGHLEHEGDAD